MPRETPIRYPRIAAAATASPAYRFTQADVLALAGYEDSQRRGFFEHSDIESRFLCIDPMRFHPPESVEEMQARFCEGALTLGEAAARQGLARAGWSAADLDFLVTTTCTGRLTPSLDAHLIARLGCRSDVQRAHIGDTGCASAMVALQQAWNHLRAFPTHRALVIAVEICSAAYYLDHRLESAVAHAIFADGAGAVALSLDGPGPAIVAHRTLFRSEHLDAMGFEYPGGRPRVILSKDVRRIGPAMLKEMAQALMGAQGLKREAVRYWVLHSAGRRVLERAADLLGLGDAEMAHARAVLRTYGNMSSATILFVLERTLQAESPMPGEWGLMIGLGPGFTAEGALLCW
ncbi:MAG TPA: 3-oxoacyl-[acyl-carrier-protein] synthase III C-terminal domain-containing protein [Methylomirabilota bacterium]|nr:3-oxoacyl-[acyl-carrier-protein] synthase III C-terminal domain-containing protein [Methylomirabilota bacterium]